MSRRICAPVLLSAVVVACSGGADIVGGGPDASTGPADAGDTIANDATGGGDASDGGGTKQPVTPTALIVRKLFIGDTDRSGVVNKDAWKAYGRNIDGLVTQIDSANDPDLATHCRRYAGSPPSVLNDGTDGIDNAWGHEIVPLFAPFTPNATKNANDGIAAGGRTAMMSLTGTGGTFVFAEATTSPPTFAASESRPVGFDWMQNGTAKSVIFGGGVGGDGFYDSGTLVGTTLLYLPLGNDGFEITLRAANVRMQLAPDESVATLGVLSGVMATEELVSAIAAMAGRMSVDLCSGSTIDAIKESIRQASDIMQDGTQDPSKDCDGISIGLGFEATRVVVGAVAQEPAPPSDPCQ